MATIEATGKQLSNGTNGNNMPADIGQRLLDAMDKRNAGRLSTFTEERALALLESIMAGTTVQQACDDIGIARTTYYVWRELAPGFGDMIRKAHEFQADSMVDDNVAALAAVDVSSSDADPRLVMAQLRKAEQVARFKFDLAKCLNNKYIEKKHNLNINVDAASFLPVDLSRYE